MLRADAAIQVTKDRGVFCQSKRAASPAPLHTVLSPRCTETSRCQRKQVLTPPPLPCA